MRGCVGLCACAIVRRCAVLVRVHVLVFVPVLVLVHMLVFALVLVLVLVLERVLVPCCVELLCVDHPRNTMEGLGWSMFKLCLLFVCCFLFIRGSFHDAKPYFSMF